MQQGDLSWHEWREAHANASEAPAVLSIGRFTPKNPRELTMVRRGDITIPQTYAMKMGQKLEAQALAAAGGKLNRQLNPAVEEATIDGIPMSASFDGVCDDLWVEVKVCMSEQSPYWLDAKKNKVEDSVYAQMTHQMMVLQEKQSVAHDGYLYVCQHSDVANGILVPFHGSESYADNLMNHWKVVWQYIKDGKVVGERGDRAWLAETKRFAILHKRLEQVEKKYEASRKKLLTLSKGEAACGGGVVVTPCVRAGGYDYSSLGKDILEALPRKPDTDYFSVRLEKKQATSTAAPTATPTEEQTNGN